MGLSGKSMKLAVRNVALWGDTDVLPYPLENHWFHDEESQVVSLLAELDGDFDNWIDDYPVVSENCLSSVGYTGYRGITQIDPIWNVYLLALVIEIADDIEKARIGIDRNVVYSYRYLPNLEKSSLFHPNVNWGAFQKQALDQSSRHSHVVSTDISDFYPRIYHHRLENALQEATTDTEVSRRIKIVLKHLTDGGVSYGLPVGGNASRLLAELVLDRTDRLLADKGFKFCRFVDDYYIFADSTEEARRSLVVLSQLLLRNEGLSLHRVKTRLLTREEFRLASPLAELQDLSAENQTEAHQFLKLRIKYDPYSPTSDEDYEQLKDELQEFDIVGMLAREFEKSRVDTVLVKHLVKSIRFLDSHLKDAAVESVAANLDILYPVFPTVALVLRALLPDLEPKLQGSIFSAIRGLVESDSHIMLVPVNLAFALRVLVDDPADETTALLQSVYDKCDSSLLRRDIVLCLARRGVHYWIGDLLKKATSGHVWEERALIPASYTLQDEGKHWRKKTKSRLSRVDEEFLKWIGGKNNGSSWRIPM